uniref:Uncharacterized protein n=1 Tax=Anopheles minimus TaxID=112268 RepID=A0A182VTF3_9DIPT
MPLGSAAAAEGTTNAPGSIGTRSRVHRFRQHPLFRRNELLFRRTNELTSNGEDEDEDDEDDLNEPATTMSTTTMAPPITVSVIETGNGRNGT